MGLILALETTTSVCSVALGQECDYVIESVEAPRQHNQLLLTMIDRACKSLGIQRNEIDCIAFSAGPGSFTGVRISAAVAQGIGLAVDGQILGVPTCLCMGHRIVQIYQPEGEFRLLRLSRGDWVYESKLKSSSGSCEIVEPDQLLDRNEISDEVATYSYGDLQASAEDVLAIACRSESKWMSPDQAQPIYVEGDHPWKPSH